MSQGWLLPGLRTETKQELRARAQRIHHLLACLADLPGDQGRISWQVETLESLIAKGSAGNMTMNDWDGMMRNGPGDLEEELSRGQVLAMRRDKSYWKPMPHGWIGMKAGDLYRCKMHPRELAMLKEILAEQHELERAIKAAVPDWQREVAELQAVGPLPPDIASRLNLTSEGLRRP